MKIGILSRNPKIYSTHRLVKAALARGHEVQVVNPLRCYMNITSANRAFYQTFRTSADETEGCHIILSAFWIKYASSQPHFVVSSLQAKSSTTHRLLPSTTSRRRTSLLSWPARYESAVLGHQGPELFVFFRVIVLNEIDLIE